MMSKEPHRDQHPSKSQPAKPPSGGRSSSQMEGNQAISARRGYDADPGQNPEVGAGQPDPKYRTGKSSAERAESDPNLPQEPEPVDQAELDADKPTLTKEEAEQLLRGGHKLRRKGDPVESWISMTRHGDDLVIALAATPETIEHFLSEEYILAE
jgi:hypothetical protein